MKYVFKRYLKHDDGFMCRLSSLTLILLTWSVSWAPNNESKWHVGFNSAFKGLSRLEALTRRIFLIHNLQCFQIQDLVDINYF